jgi:Secretion system C-terminal sorting domain
MWVASFGNGMRVGETNSVSVLETSKKTDFEVKLLQNPVIESVDFQVNSIISSNLLAQVVDVKGRVVYSKNLSKCDGEKRYSLPVSSLDVGLYFLKISDEIKGTQVVLKMIKEI